MLNDGLVRAIWKRAGGRNAAGAPAVRREHFGFQGEGLGLAGAVFHGSLDADGGGIRRDLGRGFMDESASA